MAVFTNTGLQLLNDSVLGIETDPFYPLTLRLFVNDITFGTLTASVTECSATGYAGEAIDPGDWSAAFDGDVLVYDHDPVSFTFSDSGGGQVVYGWYLTSDNGDALVCGGTFLNPYTIPGGGGTYAVKPSWRDGSCS